MRTGGEADLVLGPVRVRADGDVLEATIDRPQTRNAIDLEVVAGLERVVEIATERAVKVVVFKGAAGTFSSGADLLYLRSILDDDAAVRAFMTRLGEVLRALESAPWVNLAQVEGYALAGGCELLLACDVVVAAEDAQIGDRHVEYGLVPAAGGSVKLAAATSPLFAHYLLLTGAILSGADAARWGLASVAVAPQCLTEEVGRIVERLRSRGHGTLRSIKEMLNDGRRPVLDARFQRELELFVSHLDRSDDARIGLSAFAEKAVPDFDRDGRP